MAVSASLVGPEYLLYGSLCLENTYTYILCSQDTVARYQIPTIIIAGSIRVPQVHLVLTRQTECFLSIYLVSGQVDQVQSSRLQH